jgi:hypothetical protein
MLNDLLKLRYKNLNYFSIVQTIFYVLNVHLMGKGN